MIPNLFDLWWWLKPLALTGFIANIIMTIIMCASRREIFSDSDVWSWLISIPYVISAAALFLPFIAQIVVWILNLLIGLWDPAIWH